MSPICRCYRPVLYQLSIIFLVFTGSLVGNVNKLYGFIASYLLLSGNKSIMIKVLTKGQL